MAPLDETTDRTGDLAGTVAQACRLLARLGLAASGRSPGDLLAGVAQAVEIRAAWARYGL